MVIEPLASTWICTNSLWKYLKQRTTQAAFSIGRCKVQVSFKKLSGIDFYFDKETESFFKSKTLHFISSFLLQNETFEKSFLPTLFSSEKWKNIIIIIWNAILLYICNIKCGAQRNLPE